LTLKSNAGHEQPVAVATGDMSDDAALEDIDARPDYKVVFALIERCKAGSSPAELGEILRTDPILTYALLTDINSGSAVHTSHINSCAQAIELIGLPSLIEWLDGALLHAVKTSGLSENVQNALIRARFMELVGRSIMSRDSTEDMYLVGLFSRLDKLLNIPLVELILPLPFSEELQAAILENRGRIGRLLKFSQSIEKADESGMDFMQTNLHLPSMEVYEAYNEAYDWMKAIDAQRSGTAPVVHSD
jgi:EAL and modified HD-GYP domain-containing signal transduction protein